MNDNKITSDHAKIIGDMLGYVEKAATTKGRRFFYHLQGDVKDWNYDETFNWGDVATKLLPIISFLIEEGYTIPNFHLDYFERNTI